MPVAAAKSAYEKYLKFLKEELQPKSDGSFVLGKDAYEFHLRTDHFLALSADELEKIGRSEFEKTERMLVEIAKDWPDVLEKMKHDHPTSAGLLDYYRKQVAKARQYMVDHAIVTVPAGEKLEVVETPAFLQSAIPYAAYSRPGRMRAGWSYFIGFPQTARDFTQFSQTRLTNAGAGDRRREGLGRR